MPKGKGTPTREDPQIFLGATAVTMLSPPFSTLLRHPFPVLFFSPFRSPSLNFIQFLDISFDICFSHPYSSLLSVDLASFSRRDVLTYTNQFPHHIFEPIYEMLNGIQHPRFLRISQHQYAISNPDGAYQWYVHVGQIMNYLAFDKFIHEDKKLSNFPGVPLGYTDFAVAFNTGTCTSDKCQLSTYTHTSTGDHIIKSGNPVFLEDFAITPEQCGFAAPRRDGLSEAQAFIFEDYATSQAYKNKRRREQFEAREAKRQNLFGKYGGTKNKQHRFDPLAITINDTSDDDTSFGVFDANTSRASSSGANKSAEASSKLPKSSSTGITASDIISRHINNSSVPTATTATTAETAVKLPTKKSGGNSRGNKQPPADDKMQE